MKIVAQNKEHLKNLIKKEVLLYGEQCNLNHIDTSIIKDMFYLFSDSQFNGDISRWNTCIVKKMHSMFRDSQFNGDISGWNVSNVVNMEAMFYNSKFAGDISEWNVVNATHIRNAFLSSCAPVPYWAKIKNNEERKKAIEAYHTKKILDENIKNNRVVKNNFKI